MTKANPEANPSATHEVTVMAKECNWIGLLGGSFDPIHRGHVALAQAARDQLALRAVHLLIAPQPWQKPPLKAGAAQRLAMVQAALADHPGLVADGSELAQEGPTYTVDTLTRLRAANPDPVWVWIMGSDQLANLHTWRRWRDLFDLAHVAVAQRAGEAPLDQRDTLAPELQVELRQRQCMRPDDATCGSIFFFDMPPMAVSATEVRMRLARGERPVDMVPTPVLDYIDQHRLYR